LRFIVTGHDGILSVDGALLALIVPHNREIQQPAGGNLAKFEQVVVTAATLMPHSCSGAFGR
jgi:hypothetical protein